MHYTERKMSKADTIVFYCTVGLVLSPVLIFAVPLWCLKDWRIERARKAYFKKAEQEEQAKAERDLLYRQRAVEVEEANRQIQAREDSEPHPDAGGANAWALFGK
jgi:hypothetical protein